MPEGAMPPMPGAGGPPGATPGGSPPAAIPNSPVGGPGGPGSSPMLSPGSGAGNRADAMVKVKTALPALLIASLAFEPGSKEQQAILRAVSSLNPVFGKGEGANMVPAGLAAMAQASKKGPPMAAPPPGVMGEAGGGAPPAMPPGMPPGGEAA